MDVLFLGTGAAEGIPALGCNCSICAAARKCGGKDVRGRSAVLIDQRLKIDFGPDTLAQIQRERINPTDWHNILITHSHNDHCCLSEFRYLAPGFADEEWVHSLTFWGSAAVCANIREAAPWLNCHELYAFKETAIDGYRVTPVPARHKEGEQCFNYLVEGAGCGLLYGCDTGVYSDEVFDFLAGKPIDVLILECNKGLRPDPYAAHLGVAELKDVVEKLQRNKTLKPTSQVFATHFSHRGEAVHVQMEKALAPDVCCAYDGLRYRLPMN